jgi:hypothetical protein
MPTHLMIEIEAIFRRLNTSCFSPSLQVRTNRAFTPDSFSPGNPWLVYGSNDRLHLTEHLNAMPASWRCPRRPRETLLRAWADFRQELGKECDSIHAMREIGANSSARQSDLDRWCRSGRGVTDGREPDQPNPTPDFREGSCGWSGLPFMRRFAFSRMRLRTGTEWRFFRRISDKVSRRDTLFWPTPRIH